MFEKKYALKNLKQAKELITLLSEHSEHLPLTLIKQQLIEVRTNIELAEIKLKGKLK